ncbi:hypothetical protein KEM52_005445 [Ascosphaera acerosa]|nr:hypothetical protein KEM52_005445 [Ascosphaera acerosa]
MAGDSRPVSIDTIVDALRRTVGNAALMSCLPACLWMCGVPTSSAAFVLALGYAGLLVVLPLLLRLNNSIAYGPPRVFRPAQEVVVVAGGASGIGRAIAQQCVSKGVRVAVLDIREAEHLSARAAERARSYRCDATDLQQLQAVSEQIRRELGHPTVLINSIATAINPHPLLESDPAAIRRTIDANLMTYFNCLKTFLPLLVASRSGGHVVTLSSVIGWLTAAGLTDYSATKAGMTAAHRALQAELHASGAGGAVKALLVEMGQVATPLFAALDTPNAFFAPVVPPAAVAEQVMRVVEAGRGGVLRVPFYANFVGLYAILPGSVQRLARWLSGIDLAVARSRG